MSIPCIIVDQTGQLLQNQSQILTEQPRRNCRLTISTPSMVSAFDHRKAP
jgi:hypothetical protein